MSSYIRRLTHKDPYAVYILVENDTQDVVYVGLTSNPTRRASQHRCASRGFSLRVLAVLQGLEEGTRVEEALTQVYKDRGCDLLNEVLKTAPARSAPLHSLLKVRTAAQNREVHAETQRMIREGARMAEVFK